MRKVREYRYVGRDPPCASCGVGGEPDDMPDLPVREVIEECCGDQERHEYLGDWNGEFPESCVFHEGCWKLLTRHFNNGVVPLDKLINVVKEPSWPRYRAYNQEELLGYVIPETGTPSSRCFRYIGFRAEAKTFPKRANMEMKHPMKTDAQGNDCFRLLPLEIRFEIAYLLPTPEYLSMRLASKAMLPIFESQTFWKTRFSIERELGYLNYLVKDGCKDWRLVYCCTGKLMRLTKTLRFRRLQWLHNEWIKDRCMMVRDPKSQLSKNNTRFQGLLWKKAAGEMQCDRPYRPGPYRFDNTPSSALDNEVCKRCNGVHILPPPQMVGVSRELVEIAVSVLAEDEHSFITGFNLIYGENSPNVSFGYQISQKQIKIDLRGQSLAGFEIFAGEGGIQAIRPIFTQEYGTCHSVIGKPNTTCKSVSLVPDGEIKAFMGDFDHCRMVSLAVGSVCAGS